MRFLIMHKNDPNTEAGGTPSEELIANMGAFIGEHAQAGRFQGGEGLRASKTRTRLRFRDGRATVKRGPYAGEHELPACVLSLKVKSVDEALGWAERYGRILGDGELELGAVTEPWDLGMMPRPDDAPLRMLLIEKASAASEAGQPRTPQQKAALTRLKGEMTAAGVLVSTEALAPSAQAKRIFYTNEAFRVVDGPFAESKELIGGFAILELADMDEALALCRSYAQILGGPLEMDVRLGLGEGD